MKITFFIFLILTVLVGEESTVDGCSSSVSKNSEGCDAQMLTLKEKKDIFNMNENVSSSYNSQINITKVLNFVRVDHEGKDLTISRSIRDNKSSCPPFCIEPMNIKGVKTVGELETLAFIKNLKAKERTLMLDTRESSYYQEGTILGALNLPSHMLQIESQYFQEVMRVLGIKKVAHKWQFKEIHTLLIFDDGITDEKASNAIKSLLKISYPSDKILYYRGGFRSWTDLGLTTYKK